MTHLSRQYKQQREAQMAILARGLEPAPLALSFLTKYSKRTLIIVTTATRKEPQARVPMCLKLAHLKAIQIETVPYLSFWLSEPWPEKYHMQVVAAVTNICTASRKAITQKRPKSMNRKAYRTSSWYCMEPT